GVVAINDSGPLRLRYGGVRDLLIGVTLVRSDGVVVRGGGKVVKNVAGYDLPKLMSGSLGTLGFLVEATFRLHPRPVAVRTLIFETMDVELARELVLRMLDSTLVPTGLSLRWARASSVEVLLRFGGIAPAVMAQVEAAGGIAARAGVEAHELERDEGEA